MKKSVKGLFVAAAAVAAVSLTACAPKTAEKAEDKLKEKEYAVVVLDGTLVDLMGIEGLESIVTGTKTVDDKLESVAAYYFESSSAAKDAMEKIEKEVKKDDSDANVKRSGKIIYGGTEQAMKDFN